MTDDEKSLGDQNTLGGKSPEKDIDAQSLGDQSTHDGHSDTDSVGDSSSLGDQLTFGGDGAGEALNDGMEIVDLESRYTIERVLGKGGMGEVLLATDTRLERKVAIKRILGKAARSKTAVNRFLTEAKSVAALNHTNIVQIHDYGRDKEGPFLIMEYVAGESLLERCQQGAIALKEAIELTVQLCDGLAAAHDAHIIHRDIKPANILLTKNNIPKLTDFGLAKAETADTGMTMAGAVLGTLDFMPPEQRRDAALVDERSDLWSLAATLYQVFTGESPKVIRLKKVPPQLQDVLDKALEEAKDDRYQTAREFRDALRSSLTAPDRPAVEAVAELGQGECPECHAKNKDTKKYCTGCGASLRVDCLGCNESIPVWDKACGECGARQHEEIQKLQKKRTRQRSKLERLLQACEFDKAREQVSVYRDAYDPRVDGDNQWADDFVTRIDEKKELEQKRIVELMREAKSHQVEFDYDSGIRTLEQVPIALMGQSVQGHSQTPQEVVDELTITVTEVKRLDGLLKKRIPAAKKTRIDQLEIAEQLLELQPDRNVQRIHDELVEREREVTAESEELAAKAQTFYEQQDYDQCLQQLKLIQKDYLTKETETLQQSATEKRERLEELDNEIDHFIETVTPPATRTDFNINFEKGLLPFVEEYLELRPDSEKMLQLRGELLEHQKHFEESKKHRAAFDYNAAIEAIEVIPGPMRSPEMVSYLHSLESAKQELRDLITTIKERVKCRDLDGLLTLVHRAVELLGKPGKLAVLLEQLTKRILAQGFEGLKTLKGHGDSVYSVAFSPDGKTLASGSWDKMIKLWDVQSGKKLDTLTGHTCDVYSVAFSPNGKTIASGGQDQTIKLWDVESGTELNTLKGHKDTVTNVAFSPDGKTVASGTGDDTIKLWDVQSGKELDTLKGHTHSVESVDFSPDGKTLGSGSWDKTIKLWNVQSGIEFGTLKGHRDSVESVAFSPDGKTLASGSWDKMIKLWNVQSGIEFGTLKGHAKGVFCVAFSPDGKTLASGSSDATIKLWDVESGKELNTLSGHVGIVYSVAFSPDGKTVASGSHDKTIKLWDVGDYLKAIDYIKKKQTDPSD